MKNNIILIFLLFFIKSTRGLKCHSCLTYCKTINGRVDPINCDCKSSESEQCSADACFVKIELFPEESTAIVQKGCVSDIPAGQKGCQYASNTDTIHCFCDKERCNTRHMLNSYIPTRLPTVECCMCTSRHGEDCDSNSCLKKCKGNYCVVDFDGNEQGCGLGFPRLPSFLRTSNYMHHHNDYICAKYESSSTHVMNGCICTHSSGSCNELNRTTAFQERNVINRRRDNQHYCYSLMHKAYKPFGQEVFKKSSTCEGHYCFISLTTSEIVLESADFKHNYEDHDEFVGVARPRFELQAGCIRVDNDEKVTTGCTVETQGNNSEILAKHCICDSHLCNFHHLVKGVDDPRPKAKSSDKSLNPPIAPVRLYTSEIDENHILSPISSALLIVPWLSLLIPFL